MTILTFPRRLSPFSSFSAPKAYYTPKPLMRSSDFGKSQPKTPPKSFEGSSSGTAQLRRSGPASRGSFISSARSEQGIGTPWRSIVGWPAHAQEEVIVNLLIRRGATLENLLDQATSVRLSLNDQVVSRIRQRVGEELAQELPANDLEVNPFITESLTSPESLWRYRHEQQFRTWAGPQGSVDTFVNFMAGAQDSAKPWPAQDEICARFIQAACRPGIQQHHIPISDDRLAFYRRQVARLRQSMGSSCTSEAGWHSRDSMACFSSPLENAALVYALNVTPEALPLFAADLLDRARSQQLSVRVELPNPESDSAVVQRMLLSPYRLLFYLDHRGADFMQHYLSSAVYFYPFAFSGTIFGPHFFDTLELASSKLTGVHGLRLPDIPSSFMAQSLAYFEEECSQGLADASVNLLRSHITPREGDEFRRSLTERMRDWFINGS